MKRKPYIKIGSLSEIVDFLKIVGEIQQLVQTFTDNSLRRNFALIPIPIYPLNFPKFCPNQK